MRMLPASPAQTFQQAMLLHDHGRLLEAEQLYQAVLVADDRHFGALCRLGLLRLQQRRFADAEAFCRRAVKSDKRSADAHELLGSALIGLSRPADAVRAYEKAIALRPSFAEAHNNLGYALQVSGRFDEALAHYRKAAAIRPDYHEARNNIGNALHLLGRSEEAIAQYDTALKLKPDYAEAYWNLATALRAVGRTADAVAHYEKAIAIRPDYHEAHNSLGNALRSLGRLDEAVSRYETAVSIRPTYREARLNLGDTLVALERADGAIAAYDGVLALNPNDAEALTKRGHALARLRRDTEAIACYEAALSADPNHDLAFDGLARAALAACDWTRTAALRDAVCARVANGRFFSAFSFLGFSGDPALQRACAARFMREEVPVRPPRLWRGETWSSSKIKIAYVSCGFHKHPTAYLTAELIEIHDRTRFDIVGVSLGPDDGSEIRNRLMRAFDQFYDMRWTSDREVAALLNELKVDIAVDRSGYTLNARPGIFACRPAPIQVNYIGYPGTLGADCYDYIIADPTVLAFDQQPFFSEQIVHLPGSYLVNDATRRIAARTPTRGEMGLPANGFVFCCFNNSYKITPPVFDVWMRLLGHVDGSVLWLLGGRSDVEDNLRREARTRGIDPSRLVFAGRLPNEDHLARHRLADLFLDTLPYNAHTTAADALWAGLPVVTCRGTSFAGRVAASLLRAIGMPELVTDDFESYEALALRIASEPSLLQGVRERLSHNRLAYPLFDSQRYRGYLEAAYVRMWETWQRGQAPTRFAVDPEADDPIGPATASLAGS